MKTLILPIAALLIASSALLGCETTKHPAGVGLVTGAAAGGLVGSTKGKAVERALIGGAVGGATGLVVDEMNDNSKNKK